MRSIIIFVAGLSVGGILPAIGLVSASGAISRQNGALDSSTTALKNLMSACDRRNAAQDNLAAEMRRGLEVRDRLIAQLRAQPPEAPRDR